MPKFVVIFFVFALYAYGASGKWIHFSVLLISFFIVWFIIWLFDYIADVKKNMLLLQQEKESEIARLKAAEAAEKARQAHLAAEEKKRLKAAEAAEKARQAQLAAEEKKHLEAAEAAEKARLKEEEEKAAQHVTLEYEFDKYFSGPFDPYFISFLKSIFETGYYDKNLLMRELSLSNDEFVEFDSLIKSMQIVDKNTNALRIFPSVYKEFHTGLVNIFIRKRDTCLNVFLSMVDYPTDKIFVYIWKSVNLAFSKGTLSIPMLQRELKITYDFAKDLLLCLEKAGIITALLEEGPPFRHVIMSKSLFSLCWLKLEEELKLRLSAKLEEIEQNTLLFDQQLEHEIETHLQEAEAAEERGDFEEAERLRSLADTKKQIYFNQADSYTDDEALSIQTSETLDTFDIDSMSGGDFEILCAKILEKKGFSEITLTKTTGDQGVDILAEKDGLKYAIQCKCYSRDLGNTPIQEVYAGMAFYNCHVGIVMTNRHFTSGAHQAAQATGVLLWDRDWILSHLKCD